MNGPSMPQLPCMCASFRRASRALTQRYDRALRPLGLTITQFTILQALSIAGEVHQGRLGEILSVDSTTLTRTLELLAKHRWIQKRYGKDRRERQIGLSRAGERELNRALPFWHSVQAELRSELGDRRWSGLLNLTNEVAAKAAR